MGGAMLLESRLLPCLGVSQCSASESRLLFYLGESVTYCFVSESPLLLMTNTQIHKICV